MQLCSKILLKACDIYHAARTGLILGCCLRESRLCFRTFFLLSSLFSFLLFPFHLYRKLRKHRKRSTWNSRPMQSGLRRPQWPNGRAAALSLLPIKGASEHVQKVNAWSEGNLAAPSERTASKWTLRHLIAHRLIVRPPTAFLSVLRDEHDTKCPVCQDMQRCHQGVHDIRVKALTKKNLRTLITRENASCWSWRVGSSGLHLRGQVRPSS